MDSDYIQHVRYKLQKRLKHLNTADFQAFHFVLLRVWGFLQDNEITKGILDDLAQRCATAEAEADKTLAGEPQVGTTESDNDAICYWVVQKCAISSVSDIEIKIGFHLTRESKYADCIEGFRTTYLEPLFDYIDEHIDDKRMVLVLLKKYKQRCEWFHRTELYDKYKEDTGRGEKTLAMGLYEYLHDQGVQFHIEPSSASGRIDMISEQSGPDRLIADAKLFNPERSQGRTYIVEGFRQVYDYAKDYNEPFAYLVIFKTCEQDLVITTAHQESSIPFFTHNNKTIFFVIIDIHDYQASASQRGRLRAHEITPEQIVQHIESRDENMGSAQSQPGNDTPSQ